MWEFSRAGRRRLACRVRQQCIELMDWIFGELPENVEETPRSIARQYRQRRFPGAPSYSTGTKPFTSHQSRSAR
jgi:hypothetical protein